MKEFVFNLGFDTSHIHSVLAAEEIDEGSNINVVVAGKTNERTENALKELKTFIDKNYQDVQLNTVELGEKFTDKVLNTLKLFRRLEKPIILSLSGGPRENLASLIIAATQKNDKINKVYLRRDVDSKLEEIDLPSLQRKLTKDKAIILNKIRKNQNNSSNIEELNKDLKLSKSTIRRKLKQMTEEKLVTENKDGKQHIYKITITGELSLEQE